MKPRNGQMIAELGLWTIGLVALSLFLFARAGGEFERVRAIERFTEARADQTLVADGVIASPGIAATVIAQSSMRSQGAARLPNTDLPSPATEAASATETANLPIAILSIAAVGLEVPVFQDTSERNLNRGAGWVQGTAGPNDGGNMAIAAHRDGYFRALKDVKIGQQLDLVSLNEAQRYRVTEVLIVEPEDIWVLDATETDAVTLVTCYPFYFVGNAPKRYIVRAVVDN